MQQYTIYCTEEQTRKALELGAPIEYELDYVNGIPCKVTGGDGEPSLINPTAEEMIGWLEEQPSIVTIGVNKSICLKWEYFITKPGYNEIDSAYNYSSRKEATLASIDAALEYLEQCKR